MSIVFNTKASLFFISDLTFIFFILVYTNPDRNLEKFVGKIIAIVVVCEIFTYLAPWTVHHCTPLTGEIVFLNFFFRNKFFTFL